MVLVYFDKFTGWHPFYFLSAQFESMGGARQMVFVYSVHPSTELSYILIMESNTAYKMESLGTGHSLKRSGFLLFVFVF